ncbi:MAG: tetratricopeptide repeat protein, partial [Alphaproteobacteria bacterium]|nr:tetratricopeptide repeat protein [Alphaproteobacteria bacterium]
PPPAGRPWKWVAGTAAVMTLSIVGITTLGLGDNRHVEPEAVQVAVGEEVIARLQKAHPGARDADGGAAERGWQGLLEGTTAGLDAARVALEQGCAADPVNLPAVAGLAVVYAIDGEDDPARALDSVALLSRTQALDASAVYTLRAESGVALAAANYPGTLEATDRCLQAHPGDGVCSWYRGEALVSSERQEEALPLLEAAATHLPPSPGLNLALGAAAAGQGDFNRALGVLRDGVERFPRDAALQAALGRLYYRTGDFKQALEHSDRAVEADTGHIEARLLRGELLLHALARPREAAIAMKDLAEDPALEGSPLRRRALIQASFALLEAARTSTALELAQEAAAPEDGYGPAQLALALALNASGDAEGASAAILSAKLDGLDNRDAARFHFHAARLYLAQGRERFARRSLEDALAADPTWFPAAVALAEVELQTGDLAAALGRLEQLAWVDLRAEDGRDPILLAPPVELSLTDLKESLRTRIVEAVRPDAAVLRAYGALLTLECVRGQPTCGEARERLKTAQELDSTRAEVEVLLGRVAQVEGRHDEAVERFSALAEARARPPVLYVLLAESEFELGRNEQAEAHFAEAHSLAPEAAGFHRRHALALVARGDTEGAREHARKARALDPDDLLSAGLLLDS